MRFLPSIVVTCMLMAASAPASAASRQNHNDCNAADPDRNIAGCTIVAQDTHESPRTRANAYVARGLAWSDKGDLERAVADFTDAIRLNPKDALAYNNRGLVWNQKGEHTRAIADLSAAIEIDPLPRSDLAGSGHVNIYANRGLAWQAAGDLAHALADFDQAVELDPRDADALNRRGAAYQAKGEPDRAVADFTSAIAVDPSYANAYFNRGLIRQDKAELDTAMADFSDTIRLAPEFANAYYGRAQIYMAKQDPDGAIADLGVAIRLAPDRPYIYYLRGAAWYDRYMRASAMTTGRERLPSASSRPSGRPAIRSSVLWPSSAAPPCATNFRAPSWAGRWCRRPPSRP